MLWSIGLHQLRAAHERTEKVRAVHAVAIAEEHVVAMLFIDAEVGIEAVCHGAPPTLAAIRSAVYSSLRFPKKLSSL